MDNPISIREWLSLIANKTIRESALKQCTTNVGVKSLSDAIYLFANWSETKEGANYWYCIFNQISPGSIKVTTHKITGIGMRSHNIPFISIDLFGEEVKIPITKTMEKAYDNNTKLKLKITVELI